MSDGTSDAAIDTTELVNTLSEIANSDEEAIARSSSSEQFDSWLDVLNQWKDNLSGGDGGLASS